MAHGEPALRVDAARNQQRLVNAAREVFATHGLSAPLELVAKSAGVGIATLYRRFHTRDDLIAAAFKDKVQAYADTAEAALELDDPWDGFSHFIHAICEMQAGDAGFADLLALTFVRHPTLQADHSRAYDAFAMLTERAQRGGVLRHDFVTQDLPLLLIANAGVIAATRTTAPTAWERFAGYMLQALRAQAAAPLPDPPAAQLVIRALDATSSPVDHHSLG